VTTSLASLGSAVRGAIIEPGDPGYDEARTVFLGGIDRRPAVIVQVADAADIATVVAYARETGLELAVRSGGHSASGHGTTEGGIQLDLSAMRAIDVDVEGRTVWAEPGLTAVELTTALAEHGLAVGFGDTGSVGIGGITLGGGVGYLVRKYGLTIDSLLAAELVTADGQLLQVDADSHPDLFWAIRGGGGNFGVATRFRYALQPVPSIVGGMLILPATADTIAGFMAAADEAPEELSTIANVMPCPPLPFVPEDRHGEVVIFAFMCYAGDTEAGQRAMAPFRALGEPLADLVHPTPYPEIYPPDDPDYRPKAITRTMFIDHVDRPTAALILERLAASDASMRVAQLRMLGGAMARVPADATAFAHRRSRIMVNVAAFYEGPDDYPVREAWVKDFAAALDQGDPGAYVNFVADEGEARIRAAYPGATWDRLVAIKARYDPTNLFRLNQNISPTG
jgi:FAD binding domain/Berberine and berberine like